mmetsp:Transcript_18617/g.43045  ORF Transcript_18617/g.43045 Transcript_18617/m.43045 type:complete len:81 (-) Transcript_18617:137-379(-)
MPRALQGGRHAGSTEEDEDDGHGSFRRHRRAQDEKLLQPLVPRRLHHRVAPRPRRLPSLPGGDGPQLIVQVNEYMTTTDS